MAQDEKGQNDRTEEQMASELGIERPSSESEGASQVMREVEEALEPGLTGARRRERQKNETSARKQTANTQQNEQGNQANSQENSPSQKEKGSQSENLSEYKEKAEKFEKFAPIINEMQKDENLVNHVINYFEGGNEAPTNFKEQLNLSEDFIFDADEAVSNPDSDSAKVLNATVDRIVQSRLQETKQQMERKAAMKTKEQKFKEKHNLTDEQYQEMKKWAKNKQTDIEDIYYLYQKHEGKRDEKIHSQGQEDAMKQMQNVQNSPKRVKQGSSPDSRKDMSLEDKVFDRMLSIESDVGDVFDI